MNLPPTLPFGTDGVRGPAAEVAANAEQLARAAGTELMKPGDRALIAYDTRESSPEIAEIVANGLRAVGIDVEIAGVMPTPGLAYSIASDPNIAGGGMITASHNPYPDNGIKFFGALGNKLTDAEQDEIEHLRTGRIDNRGAGRRVPSFGRQAAYEDFLVASAPGLDLGGTTLVIDTAHGAASGIAEAVFSELGAKVIPLHDDPDGRNINLNCGATDMRILRAAAAELGVIGLGHDGDADRVLAADEQGNVFDGDRIVHLLGTSERRDGKRHAGVAVTIMTNLAIEQALTARDVKVHRTAVGDRYVLEGMLRTGYDLGGEQSGHIIQGHILGTGDGMLAGIHAIHAQRESGRTLAELSQDLTLLPQEQVAIKVPKSVVNDPRALEMLAAETERLAAMGGRHVTRPSGTEDVVRVMVELPDAAAAKQAASRIAGRLEELALAA